MFYVYVLKSLRDGMFYIGHTGDLSRRFSEHNAGAVESTRNRTPLELVYYEASRNHQDALHRERYLKTTYGHRFLRHSLKNDLGVALA